MDQLVKKNVRDQKFFSWKKKEEFGKVFKCFNCSSSRVEFTVKP